MQVTYQCVVGNSATLLYQGNNLQTFITSRFILSNSDTGTTNASLYLVPPNGTPSINNAVIYLYKVASNSFVEGQGGFVVPPKYSLWATATSGNIVVATVSGELSTNP